MEEPSSSSTPPAEPSKEINLESNDDKGEVPMEIVKDDEASPARLTISNCDDENEETLLMTIEEVQNYILSKVGTYIRDPAVNPLLILKDQITSLHDKIKIKSEEFLKLNRMFDALYRDQVKFLMHIGVMPKVETKTVGVSVDLPWLPDSVPGLINEDVLKSTADKVFLQPTNGTVPRLPKKDPSVPIECIDLSDDDDVPPVSTPAPKPSATTDVTMSSSSTSPSVSAQSIPSTSILKKNPSQHPAPLPPVPDANDREVPPKPRLKISADRNGIVLQWDMPPEAKDMKITGFEINGYQEKNNVPVSSALWKKIGCVDTMSLPMSCTLTQFVEGYKYHFSIRAFCKDNKFGHFSDPASIMFVPDTKKN